MKVLGLYSGKSVLFIVISPTCYAHFTQYARERYAYVTHTLAYVTYTLACTLCIRYSYARIRYAYVTHTLP